MDEMFDWDDLEEVQPDVGEAKKTLQSDRNHGEFGKRPKSLQQQDEKSAQPPSSTHANSVGGYSKTDSHSVVQGRAETESGHPPPPHQHSIASPSLARQLVIDGIIPGPDTFTLEKAIQLQDDMILEYSKADFQERLHKKWKEAGGDPYRQGKARQEVCFPLQCKVLERYGFEPSKRGVMAHLHAFAPHVLGASGWSQSYRMSENQLVMDNLLNPDWQNLQKGLRYVSRQNQEKSDQNQKKSALVRFEKLKSVPPVFYGHAGTSKVPCCAVTSRHALELAKYLWLDPQGPFGTLDDFGDDQDYKKLLEIWEFKKVAACNSRLAAAIPPSTLMSDGDNSLQAHWHGLADLDFHKLACVPGAKDSGLLRRAPLRIIAFLQAFREANVSCWDKLAMALRQLTPAYSGSSMALQEVVATVCANMQKGTHFGVVETRVSHGGNVTYSLPEDLPASLLHLNLTLRGSCILRIVNDTGTKTAQASRTMDVDMPVGAVHLFSPLCFEHYFDHRADACHEEDPTVTLHCSFLLGNATQLGRAFKSTSTMLQVATAISESIRISGVQRLLRLPSLAEVAKQEMTLQRQWMEFAGGALWTNWFSAFFDKDSSQVSDDLFFLGRWQCGDMILEITKVDAEFRVIKIVGQVTSRGKCLRGKRDSGLRCTLSDGSHLYMFPTYRAGGLVIKREDVMMNVDLKVAFKERPHLVTPSLSYGKDTLQTVRRQASAHWSVDAQYPSVKAESHPLKFLSACNCGPADKRSRFLGLLLEACKKTISRRSPLIYASFGSGGLWFDWWVLEALRSEGIAVASAHFIDLIYTERVVRDAGCNDSALRNIAAWLQAEGVPSYAYQEILQFHRNEPKGANLMVQCDADFPGINMVEYLSTKGLLCWLQGEGGDTGVWQRDRQGYMKQLSYCSHALADDGSRVACKS